MSDLLQRLVGFAAALATAPLLAALAVAVRLDSPGPAFFHATRMGEGGRPFDCPKLRTMTISAQAGPAVTRANDSRITRTGRFLRKLRLDELPQLWNVARGEMRLVGPRPEDPRFVDFSRPLHREVFTARPGITGLTQLLYADEGTLLRASTDPDEDYRNVILPDKLRLDAAYLRRRSTRLDLWILAQTPRSLLGRPVTLPPDLAFAVSGRHPEAGAQEEAHEATPIDA